VNVHPQGDGSNSSFTNAHVASGQETSTPFDVMVAFISGGLQQSKDGGGPQHGGGGPHAETDARHNNNRSTRIHN